MHHSFRSQHGGVRLAPVRTGEQRTRSPDSSHRRHPRAVVISLISIWVADSGRFGSIAGLITAGIAEALQRVLTSGVRAIKDAISRELLVALKEAKLDIASGTYEIVGVPPIRIEQLPTT